MANPYVENPAWVDGSTTISAAKLNNVEQGITDAHFQPCARVTHSLAQSISSATNTALAFNTERYDQDGLGTSTIHDNTVNNTRLICRVAGKYSIGGNVEWAANATGVRDVFLRLNGSAYIAYSRFSTVVASTIQQGIATDWELAVNDYVELVVFQNSGGGLNVNSTSAYSPEFWMHRVG